LFEVIEENATLANWSCVEGEEGWGSILFKDCRVNILCNTLSKPVSN
jgi:hypothetical protein